MDWHACIAVAVLSWYWSTFVQYVFHRGFGHARRIDRLHRVHLAGHHRLYPPRSLLRERFDRPRERIGKLFLVPMAPLFAALALLAPPWVLAVHAAVIGFAFWAHYWLHRQYHLSGSRLNGLAWFEARRQLHFQHHADGRTNYALVCFFWDSLFGTRVPGPRRHVDASSASRRVRPAPELPT